MLQARAPAAERRGVSGRITPGEALPFRVAYVRVNVRVSRPRFSFVSGFYLLDCGILRDFQHGVEGSLCALDFDPPGWRGNTDTAKGT